VILDRKGRVRIKRLLDYERFTSESRQPEVALRAAKDDAELAEENRLIKLLIML
jgi:hypothetical protein